MFRHSQLAENVQIPEYFCTEIGMLEIFSECIRFTMASPGWCGGTQLLIPQVAIVRPTKALSESISMVERYVAVSRLRGAVMNELLTTH